MGSDVNGAGRLTAYLGTSLAVEIGLTFLILRSMMQKPLDKRCPYLYNGLTGRQLKGTDMKFKIAEQDKEQVFDVGLKTDSDGGVNITINAIKVAWFALDGTLCLHYNTEEEMLLLKGIKFTDNGQIVTE